MAFVATKERQGKRSRLSLVNSSLETVSVLSFEDATVFVDGMCPVKLKGKWGYIDRNGALVIDAVYKEAREFFQGRAIVRTEQGAFLIVDKYGNVLSKYYDWISDAPLRKAWARYELLFRPGGVFINQK
ncbi:MAG: WG repeat-containing protein [Planctomycetota bacterium]|nr:WG repeat-containing protein [Planctomycetota bacterium]